MKISKIKNISYKPLVYNKKSVFGHAEISFKNDSFNYFNESNFDKGVLVNRGILPENKSLFDFFDEISAEIFKDYTAKTFSSFLKKGYITLSTCAYNNLKSPHSAKGLRLDPLKSPTRNCARLEEEISSLKGVGINFSEFKNPIEQIKKINSYFKYRQDFLKRPPAGIALLNINHADIMEFITLKDNEDFKNWCFDLSVVIPDDFIEKAEKDEDIVLSNGKTIKAKTVYDTLKKSMLKTGEPGVIFSNEKDYICDSCAAAQLKNGENLTLAHINLSKFYNNSGLDFDTLKKSADILSKAMKKIDPNGYIGILGYQDLLNKMGLIYGSDEALRVLEDCLKIIKEQTLKSGIKTAISPTGGVSRLLKTTPAIEPDKNSKNDYYKEIDTLKTAQKYLDGNISKTIILTPQADLEDVDKILKYCAKCGIKGITVYKPN